MPQYFVIIACSFIFHSLISWLLFLKMLFIVLKFSIVFSFFGEALSLVAQPLTVNMVILLNP